MDEQLAKKLDELAWWWLEYREQNTIANVRDRWVPPPNVMPTIAPPKVDQPSTIEREPVFGGSLATIPEAPKKRKKAKGNPDLMLLTEASERTTIKDATFYHWHDERLVTLLKQNGRVWMKRDEVANIIGLVQTKTAHFKTPARYVAHQLRIQKFGDPKPRPRDRRDR